MSQHSSCSSKSSNSMLDSPRLATSPTTKRLLFIFGTSLACITFVQFFLASRLDQEGSEEGAQLRQREQDTKFGKPFVPSKYLRTVPPNISYDVCIVGAGLSGAVLAERYAKLLGRRSLVIESRDHIGGNCYDYVDAETGILMNLYGAHLFHTNNERVWQYVQSFQDRAPWVKWEHRVKGWIRGKLLPIPVNIDTVNALFNLNISSSSEMDAWLRSVQVPCSGSSPSSSRSSPSSHAVEGCENAEAMALSRVGKQLYEWVFKRYTEKQWGRSPGELDAAITARIPVRNSSDPRYFTDKHQVLPLHGYTHWFEGLLQSPLISVVLGVDFFSVQHSVQHRCGKTFFTGPVDRYFAKAGLGKLEYRSIRFEKEVVRDVGASFYQENSVVNYPGPEEGFTRIVEYKHFLQQRSKHTVIVKEFSTDAGDPYYPVLNQRNRDLHRQYQRLAEEEEHKKEVYFVGRLANYKYFDMDAAIANALSVFERVEKMESLFDLKVGRG
mmetsp:Transcript_42627/g.100636  ORF Transcript_42627/g.100636 Transcript_42627/m.100636 type:complete len:496 (+) Transcript_42627:425-1912(+)